MTKTFTGLCGSVILAAIGAHSAAAATVRLVCGYKPPNGPSQVLPVTIGDGKIQWVVGGHDYRFVPLADGESYSPYGIKMDTLNGQPDIESFAVTILQSQGISYLWIDTSRRDFQIARGDCIALVSDKTKN